MIATESDTAPSTNDSHTQPVYRDRDKKTVPASVINACLYALGYQQWLCPNADIEYVRESRKIAQGIYAAVLISHGQFAESNQHNSEPDWEALREFRDSIYDQHFYVPWLFDMTDYEMPDDMFDAVEAELVAHGLLNDIPPERTKQFVSTDD